MNLIRSLGVSHFNLPFFRRTTISATIDSLVKKRLSDQTLEWERLKTRPRVVHSLEFIERTFESNAQKVAFGHSLELQDTLKDTHFVINHGASNKGLIMNMVAKKSMELMNKKKYVHFEILRHPVFFRAAKKQQDIEFFKRVLNPLSSDGILDDANYRDELICGDIHLENTAPLESAISFFLSSKSIAIEKDQNFTKKVLREIIRSYPVDQERVDERVEELANMGILPEGSLYSICVPKKKFLSIGYLSRAYGMPVGFNYSLPELDICQSGHLPSKSWEHRYRWHQEKSGPQVRLLTREITPENGVFIVPHTTLSPACVKELEGEVEVSLSKIL